MIATARGRFSFADADADAVAAEARRVTTAHRLLLTVAVTTAALLLTVTPASAARTYSCQITASATPSSSECNSTGNTVPGGAFSHPYGLAVDSADNLWVSDTGNGVVDKFDSAGNFLAQGSGFANYGGQYIQGLGYGNSANLLYVADSGSDDIWGINSDGSYSGTDLNSGIGGGCCFIRVAADNSGTVTDGDLYVAGVSGGVVRIDASASPVNFTAGANAGTNALTGPFEDARNVAIDASGNIFVVGSKEVDEFDSTGALVQSFDGSGAPGGFSSNLTGVAIDPTNGNVLIVDSGNNVVDEFDSSGLYLGQLVGTGTSQSAAFGSLEGGIAINSSGFVFLADASKQVVDVFTPNSILPKVTYGAVTDQTRTSATLNASVDLNGGPDVTSCEFQYGTDTSYGSSVPCSPSTPYSGNTTVFADLSGLTVETTYHYRIVLATTNGTKKGVGKTLTTSGAVLALSTDPPTNSVDGHETLNGSFAADGHDTTYYFEYVEDADYNPAAPDPYSAGQTTPVADAGSGSGAQNVSAVVEGLPVYAPYHYRIVATNSIGTSYGQDRRFFSPPPELPTIDATTSSGVTQSTVTLNAQVSPGPGTTVVRFEYGTTTSYGSHTYPSEPIGPDNANHPLSADVSGLTPGSTYHFRVIATNFGGTVRGPDQTFNTTDLPLVADSGASEIGQATATLRASIRPGFSSTTYHFDFGSTAAYGSSTPESASIGSDNASHSASAAISGLATGATYHFRVVATNAIGVTDGPDQTFNTASGTPIISPLPTVCKTGFFRKQGKCVKRHRKREHHRRSHR